MNLLYEGSRRFNAKWLMVGLCYLEVNEMLHCLTVFSGFVLILQLVWKTITFPRYVFCPWAQRFDHCDKAYILYVKVYDFSTVVTHWTGFMGTVVCMKRKRHLFVLIMQTCWSFSDFMWVSLNLRPRLDKRSRHMIPPLGGPKGLMKAVKPWSEGRACEDSRKNHEPHLLFMMLKHIHLVSLTLSTKATKVLILIYQI